MKFKVLADCYKAANEYDHVPEPGKEEEINNLLGTELTKEDLQKYQGLRHYEVADRIISEISRLEEVSARIADVKNVLEHISTESSDSIDCAIVDCTKSLKILND